MDLQALTAAPRFREVLARRRRQRARSFLSRIEVTPRMRVIDVGCGSDGMSLEAELPPHWEIIGVDLLESSRVHISHPGFTYLEQDARDLSRFRDGEFDLAVSVGMMEHICDRKSLAQIASEMARVARQVVVVVPWRYAWLEPHFKLPFFQLLPFRLQRGLVRAFNPQGHAQLAADPEAFRRHLAATYQWLPTREWKRVVGADQAFLTPTLECLVLVRGGVPARRGG